MEHILKATGAPSAIGPYSLAVEHNGMIFVSGQLPIDSVTGSFAGADIASQTKQSLSNIQSILTSIGLDLSNVIKTTVFLSDMNNFGDMNGVYATFFKENCPARSAIEVARLPKDALVEIEAIAVR